MLAPNEARAASAKFACCQQRCLYCSTVTPDIGLPGRSAGTSHELNNEMYVLCAGWAPT
jgi:hypothetical protein